MQQSGNHTVPFAIDDCSFLFIRGIARIWHYLFFVYRHGRGKDFIRSVGLG